MDGELSPLFASDAFMHTDGWMNESFSGLSSIIPDPTNLTDYKP